jgi:general secretion pathway protein M
MSNAVSTLRDTLQSWWSQRPAREKPLLLGAAILVSAALLWWVAIAPAVRTLSGFDAKWAAQDAQLQTMLRLQNQAQSLTAQAPLSTAAAAQALLASVQQSFGTQADVQIQGNSATVTLRGVPGEALAQWLATARANARSVPVQTRLKRGPNGWTGTMQMGLPQS